MTVSLLPSNAGLFEKAIEAVSAEAIDALSPDGLRAYWDPDTIPIEHIDILAHALSVDLWNDNWPDWKKRSVVRNWVRLEFAKGTLAGYGGFIRVEDGRLKQYVLPPGGYFAGPDLTKDEWDAYVDRHPRVRVTFATRNGEWVAPLDHFAGEAVADEDHVGPDDGRSLRGRLAFYRENRHGEDQPLQVLRTSQTTLTKQASIFEQIVLPADDPLAIYVGDAFSDNEFANADEITLRAYNYELRRDYQHTVSKLWLDTVAVGLQLRDTRHRRESEIGEAGEGIHASDALAGHDFVTPDDAALLLADVFYLHNPEIAAPITEGGSFAGHDRVGVARFQAEFMIEAPHEAFADECAADVTFQEEVFAMPNDVEHLERIHTAITAARAKRDRILTTFQTTRERKVADGYPLDGSARLGERIPNAL